MPADNAPQLTRHRISVLLVDDQQMIGEVVRRQLAPEQDIGYHFCSDPAAAIATAVEVSPTVILQDLVMPGVDGLTLVRRYRETDGLTDIPVIVLSTTEEAKVKAEAFAEGANDYIVKLPDRVELVARIRHHSHGYIAALERNEAFESLRQTYEELRRTQAQLVLREKMASLGSLVAGVAHELNTPLGALTSNNDTVLRTIRKLQAILQPAEGSPPPEADGAKATRLLALAANLCELNQSAAERMDRIITGLRSFARLDRAEEDRFDVREGLESTLAMIESRLGGRIRVVKQFDEVPEIRCFPGQINQVFMNLLTNAVEAIQGDGEIRVRTYAEADSVVVEISDTGVGIPAEELPHIFDPGYTTKGLRVGTGLGLSIVQRIIADHRGSVDIHSEVGRGTTVRLTLPAGW